MEEIERFRQIHIEFINWLETQKDVPNIEEYIFYVREKLNIYNKSSDIKILRSLVRSFNRYRGEFNFDNEAIKVSYSFFDKMRNVFKPQL